MINQVDSENAILFDPPSRKRRISAIGLVALFLVTGTFTFLLSPQLQLKPPTVGAFFAGTGIDEDDDGLNPLHDGLTASGFGTASFSATSATPSASATTTGTGTGTASG